MELHGSLDYNLKLAVESARRLSGHPIHKDTLSFWSELISEARARRSAGDHVEDSALENSIAELQLVITRAAAARNVDATG